MAFPEIISFGGIDWFLLSNNMIELDREAYENAHQTSSIMQK